MKRYVLRCKCNMIVDTCEESPKETCSDCKQAMTVEEWAEADNEFCLRLDGMHLFLASRHRYFKNLKDSLRMEKEDRNELPS